MTDSTNTSTKIRLELYGSKLKNVAGAFKGTSDPYAVVTLLANNPNEKPRVLGKTEVIKNNLNPKWTTSFDLTYDMGSLTRINVGVYDEVNKGTHKPMGSAMFEVGEVLGTRGNIKAKKLRPGGTLYARITSAPSDDASLGSIHVEFRGYKLHNVETLFGKSDPFFEISAKINAAGGGLVWQPVYRSKHIMNDLNPHWEPFSVNISRLCGGNMNQPIFIKVFDWHKNGKHVAIGACETTVSRILAAQVGSGGTGKNVDTSKAFELRKRQHQITGSLVVVSARMGGGPMTGGGIPASYGNNPEYASSLPSPLPPPVAPGRTFNALSASTPAAPTSTYDTRPDFSQALGSTANNASLDYVPAPLPPPMAPPSVPALTGVADMAPAKPKPTFVDYVSGGLELELSIAIDFTGSNGDPRSPGTLHYIHQDGQLNDYEKAITAVGGIIAKYDYDQRYPVWGFGAKYNNVIQHCFQVGTQSELPGISGVLDGYRNVFRTGLTMSGPTVFAEVIGMAAAKARSNQEASKRIGKQSYGVLLILTDGAVSDVNRTKQAIEAVCDAPLSIVIVGIGNADFSAMRFLDDFGANGCVKGRDICKFVEFNRFKNDRGALTRETLSEIPDQLVGYFYKRGIMPLNPISGSQLSLAASEPDEADVDLNLNFGADGEISLANYNGAVFDDTRYGTINSYEPSSPCSQLHSSAPQMYQPNQQSDYSAQHSSYSSIPQPYQQPPVAQPLPQQQRLFHVQAPAGLRPGEQVQVKNPITGQMLIVTIPQGVGPGGKFAVQY